MAETRTEVKKPLTKVDDDGVEMEWIEEKRGWFPKLDDEFIYRYNLNYGFTEESQKPPEPEVPVDPAVLAQQEDLKRRAYAAFGEKCSNGDINITNMSQENYNECWFTFFEDFVEKDQLRQSKFEKRKRKRELEEAGSSKEDGWFTMDDSKNRYVYVDNLPLDMELPEFVELVSKYGMILKDPLSKKLKAELYKDTDGKNKGDGKCCYIKMESVDIALNLLDGYTVRGHVISCSRAKFEPKNNFDAKKRRKLTNKEKRAMKKNEEKLYSWKLEVKGVRPKKHNTVIIKNAFDLDKMKLQPELAFDLKDKMQNALRVIGEFRSVKIHELHPEAVVQLEFKDPNMSDIVVTYFNNRFWHGRRLTAELWDGRTKYKVLESQEDAERRLTNHNKFLAGGEEKNEEESAKSDDDPEKDFDGGAVTQAEILAEMSLLKKGSHRREERESSLDEEQSDTDEEQDDEGTETPDDEEVLARDSD